MKRTVRTFTTPSTHPMTRPLRPVCMYPGELPRTATETVAVSRTDTHVGVRFHPGSPTPQVIADIAAHLYTEEGPAWLGPFEHEGPIDLAAIRADPVRALGSRLTSIPSFGPFIPIALRLPGAPWLYN